MIRILFKKLRESLIAVLPVTAIVFLLNLTPLVEFTSGEMTVFLVSLISAPIWRCRPWVNTLASV